MKNNNVAPLSRTNTTSHVSIQYFYWLLLQRTWILYLYLIVRSIFERNLSVVMTSDKQEQVRRFPLPASVKDKSESGQFPVHIFYV